MRLTIFLVICMAYVVKKALADGHQGNHVHIKIVTPVNKHVHTHTQTIIKKPKDQKKVIVHQHHHHHHHGHDHDHKHGHDHKHNHQHHNIKGQNEHDDHHHDWSKEYHNSKKHSQVGTYNSGDDINSYSFVPTFNEISSHEHPQSYDPDGYTNLHQSLRSESLHITEAKNSAANDPINKHYVTGRYQVHESDPNDYRNIQHHKIFHSPHANINLHQGNYDSTRPENSEDKGDYYYVQMEETNYGEDEGGVEDDDYQESILAQKKNKPGPSVNGVEALRQYFQNRLMKQS